MTDLHMTKALHYSNHLCERAGKKPGDEEPYGVDSGDGLKALTLRDSFGDRELSFAHPNIRPTSNQLRIAPFRMSTVESMDSGRKVRAERRRFSWS